MGRPLRRREDCFELHAVLEAGQLQAAYLNADSGRSVAGGRLIAAVLVKGQATISQIGSH